MNTDTEVILVQQEAQEMASQNEADSREVDGLFAEKQARQDQIQRLEQEVRNGGKVIWRNNFTNSSEIYVQVFIDFSGIQLPIIHKYFMK